jgi:tetratricopeptide (TPR) repeat protein
MNKAFALLTLTIFLLTFTKSWAQADDVRTVAALAKQAKNNGENAKAITFYEELVKLSNSDTYYYDLLDLYLTEKDYSSAEKMVKKRIRQFSNRPEFLVDKGHVYFVQKEERDANKSFDDAVDYALKNSQATRSVANQFNKYQYYSFSEEIYVKARKAFRNDRLYQFELANIYGRLGKTNEMMEEYLTILGGNRSYLQTIQNLFSRVLNPDTDGTQKDNLKEMLLRRIQKEPNQEVFSEMLIWLYIQDKNFTGAFIQAKALDRKNAEQGRRVYDLGNLALLNDELSTAEKSFNYVIELKDSPYYFQSKMKLVEVLKEKVIGKKDYTNEDLRNLERAYQSTIEELGKSALTTPLIRGLAELNGYYLDSVQNGIAILTEVINLQGISNFDKAEAKIELADLYLLNDEIWESSLLYSQVEKEFKYDRLGEVAKYKNAKVAFYTGDFYWAQAQLDVLKGSTSKLISNDAMDLSLLITDNVGRDSIIEPLQMFAVADLLIFKKDFEKATVVLDSIPKFFPFTTLQDDILFAKYKMAIQTRDYQKASGFLKELIAGFAEDLLGDNALFALAKLEEEEFNNKEKAMELYKSLLTTYPSSLFVVEARKRFRALRGDKLEEEIN